MQKSPPIWQAALSGYSDYAMRALAREYGADMTFSGVILDKSASHPKAIRKKRFRPGEDEHPIGGQLLGNDPKLMAAGARALEEIGYDVVDLNFACPVPKVLRRERGGYLLNCPERVAEIFKRVREAVRCAVFMKLRSGYTLGQESRDNFLRICEQAVRDGVDGLIVHGRTVEQRYRGKADREVLRELKRRFPQTLILGSGDLFTAEDIVQCLRQTGVDGVVVARGAIGNPWIFAEARALLENQTKPPEPPLQEQGRVMLRHFTMVQAQYEKRKAVAYFRKFSVNYCRRHPERKTVQRYLMEARTCAEVTSAIAHWYGLNE